MLPRLPSRLGRGHPSPDLTPLERLRRFDRRAFGDRHFVPPPKSGISAVLGLATGLRRCLPLVLTSYLRRCSE